MNTSKNLYNSLRESLLIIFSGVCIILCIILSNASFLLYPAALYILYIARKYFLSSKALYVFLAFYGFLGRFMFCASDRFPYNLFFVFPVLLSILFADEFWEELKTKDKSKRLLSALFAVMLLAGFLLGVSKSIFSSAVALAAYSAGPMIAFSHRINREDVEGIVSRVFPYVAILFFLQYFDIFFFFDRIYIHSVSDYMFTSLNLGSQSRPFSSFSSPEELSSFLCLSTLIFILSKKRNALLYAVFSFALLVLLSQRTAILIFFVCLLFIFIIKRKFFLIAVLSFLLAGAVLTSNFIIKDYTIYKTDAKHTVLIKHTFEPFKMGWNSYSLSRRVESAKHLLSDLKKNPMGTGLSHSEALTKKEKDSYPSESSAMKLLKGAGVWALLFIVFASWLSLKKMILLSACESRIIILFSLLTFLFMNGITMHFISPVISLFLFHREE